MTPDDDAAMIGIITICGVLALAAIALAVWGCV